MIKFFRHIRQKMIKDNKVTKYLLYAIGEILLVVIGILIALQINNSNEIKKSREFELKMLHEVRNELIRDTLYFNMIKKRAEVSFKGGKVMLRLYGDKETNTDTILKYGRMMSMSFQYIYHKGAYEAIKSTGIDKISNDSIRFLLTDMYDFRMPRTENFIELNKSEGLSSIEVMRLLTNLNVIKLPDGVSVPSITAKKLIPANPKVLGLIYYKTSSSSENINRLDDLINACKRFLRVLDLELKIEGGLASIPKKD